MTSPANSPAGAPGLPSITSLTNGLPPSSGASNDQHPAAEPPRDSGTWPQPQSKHNSANNQGLQVHTLLNPDDSPSRHSIPGTPQSLAAPNSAVSAGSALPSINQAFHENHNRDSRDSYNSYNRDSYNSFGRDSINRDSLNRDSINRDSLNRDSINRDSLHRDSALDSRRSSVDSRMHQGFNKLYINNPASPLDSANASQVSLAASLRRPNGQTPLSPLGHRATSRGAVAPRIAPPIMPVNRGPGVPDPTAANPTQGYAWAFPDSAIPEERRGSDSGDSSLGPAVSRQNSYAASSIRSSVFSTESQLPPGQRRFEDDSATTHHHSMQHRAIQDLQGEGLSPQGVGNYSRTPELRISHKLAERKRRSEMKDLFEELNKAVPSSGGTKASKWEILTKAIDYIRSTQLNERNLHTEVQRLQREAEFAREARKENDLLKSEVQAMHQNLRRLDPNAPHVYGGFTSQLSQQQSSSQSNGVPTLSLPPMHAAPGAHQQGPPGPYTGVPPPPAAMQGVEYGYRR